MQKGNIVKSNKHDTEGLVLALTKDGKRAKVYVLGSDGKEVWKAIDNMTVTVDGNEKCWKCNGSGIFQGGGGTLNGRFTGYTGECYACEGKGTQNNADRIRNHYYWHREHSIWKALDAIERGETPEPLYRPGTVDTVEPDPEPVEQTPEQAKQARRARRKRVQTEIPRKKEANKDDDSELIDCKGCGCVHRDDTLCPW